MRLLLLILSLILTFTSVHGNGSISPICDVTSTIRPIHPAGAKPATAASSQSLQPSAGSYTPNTAMTITITGTVNGLVIYARDSTGTHVGRWTAATGTQLITCTGINAPKFSAPQGTTLSHSNSDPKTNLRLTWTSPAIANGPITFQGMFTNGDDQATIYLFNDVTIMPPPEPTQPPPVITQPPPIGPIGPTAAPVVPQSPTGVVASAGNGLITIQFTPPRDNGGSPILGYTVSVISPPNSGIKSEYRTVPPIFFLVNNDIPYVFSIVATNAIGSSQAITTMAVTASDTISVASAPTNLQVVPQGNGQAWVSWSLPMQTGGSIISAYTVSAYEGLDGAQNIITVRTGMVYSTTVTGLKPGTSYIFSVFAINQMGVGMAAQTQQAVLIPIIGNIPLPLPITGVKAVALDRTVRLTWDQPISTTSPILSYVIRSNTGLTLNATGQPVTFDGLMNNVPYTFTVAATNVAGTGAFSIPSAAVIPFTPANLGTPGQPRIISVIVDQLGAVKVNFQPPTDVGITPITSYTVTSSITGTTKSGTSSPIIFAAGILPTGTYTFLVVAINSKGSSPASLPSMPVSVVSSTQVMAPSSPTITNLDVSKDGSTIVVTFDPPLSDGNSPITSYTAYTSDNLASIKGTTSPLTLTNVKYVDGLMVYVSATNAIGTSMPNPSSGVIINLPTGGIVTTPAPGAGTNTPGVSGFDTGKGFSCTWVISPDRIYIDVTMIGQTKGYVSWGVASGPLMLNNADYYTGYVDDTTGAVVMRDTFSNSKIQPKDDAQQDITTFSGTQVNGVTTLKFRRKLDTGDRREDFAITNTDLFVHWAIAPADNLGVYHNAYGIQRANLFTGQSSAVTLGGGVNAASLLCYMMLAIFVAYAVLRMVRRCTKNIRHSSHIATLQKQSSSSEVVPTSLENQKSMSSLNSSANMMRQQASSLSKYHDRLSGADQESQSTEDRSLQTNPALFPQAWGVSSSVSSSDGGLKHRRMNTTITPAIVQPNSAQWQRWEAQWQPLTTEEGWQYFFNQTTQETAWEIPPMPDYFTGEQGARYSMAERPSKGIDADQIKVETVPARPAMAPSAAAARYALAKKSSSCLARIQAILHYRIPRSQFSATQIMVFVGYIIINIICLMIVDQDTPLATRYGWLATANMLIVAVPATRNSVLVWVLGYAFDTVMVFHRWIGRLLLIIVSAHMFGWYALWRSQGLSIYEMQFSNISYQRGFYGWVALVVVNVLSLDFFRRRHFEFFYHTHFTFFVFYVMAYLHKPSQSTYFLITLIMYGIDRLIRTFWGIVPRKTTIVKAKGGDIVQVRFPKHPLARATKLYKVGQYVFVNFPELSLFQWHPFSISSAPEENTAEIHIRSLGDYTKAMLQRVRETKNNEMWIRVDGPYGNHRMTYHRYPVLILVGGGIGITPIISILKDIYHVGDFDPHKQPKVNAIEGICCVWVIPNQATYEWFADEFEKLIQASQNPMMPPLFLWVYVTRDKNLSPNSSFVSGKPDFDHIFECAARDYRGKATCVFSCGPDLMVSSCWDATNARKRAGDTFDFHHETFEW